MINNQSILLFSDCDINDEELIAVNSEWLYQYFVRAGITPSKYGTIYDYIVEQIRL